MATFKSEKFIPTSLMDFQMVANDVKAHFEQKDFIVSMNENAMGYFISISKGGIFKAVLGMKTALNIDMKKVPGGVSASAKVGIFGQQLLPSAITLFIAWPVLVTQITGLVSQAKLDNEALDKIEESIRRHETYGSRSASGNSQYCISCGSSIKMGAKFCSECGARL